MRIKPLKFATVLCIFVLTACQQLPVKQGQDIATAVTDPIVLRGTNGFPKPVRSGVDVQGLRTGKPSSQNVEDDFDVPPARPAVKSAEKNSDGFVSGLSQARITANVVVEADYELYQMFGNDEAAVRAYITNLFDAVSNVYRRDANIEIKPTFVRVWTTPSDPWTAYTTASALTELRTYWAYLPQVERAAVILLSGKSLGGGRAYINAVCQKTGAFDTLVMGDLDGLIYNTPGPDTWDVVVLAHELGHTFGSNHTHCTQREDGGGYYDKCYSSTAGSGTAAVCHTGTVIPSYGTIMSYCHQNTTPAFGMSNINPLSFVNAANDATIKNIIRSTAENWTTANRADGCLATSFPLTPTFLPGIINLLSQ